MLVKVFLVVFCAVTTSAGDGRENDDKNAENNFRKNSYDMFPDLPVGIVDTDNVLCREHTKLYVQNLRNFSLWAYEMRDATAKSVTGILRGSTSQFGQFEECLTSKSPFRTQYCLTSITANIPPPHTPRDPKSLNYEPNDSVLLKLHDKQDPSQLPENSALFGWCVPASCRAKDLQNYINKYLQEVDFPLKHMNVTYTSNIDENSCQIEGENQFDHVDITFGLICIIIITLVVSSTIFDICRNSSEDKLKAKSQFTKLLMAFSLRKNYRKLPYADDSNPSLKILYGMRVFCICMIIMDHRFGTHLASGVLNFDLVEEIAFWNIVFPWRFIRRFFFILSGLLVTYCLLVQYDKRFTNPGLIIFMRYVRLTPLYSFAIFYYATMLRYTGAGPMWKTIIIPEVEDCRNNWWTNLLYISNYVNVEHMCMVHSWYLPCDLHYFIIAVILCIIIHKSKRCGLVLLGVATFISLLTAFFVGLIYELPAVQFFYPEFLRMPKMQRNFILAYSKSHVRAAPYFVGMFAGYLYYRMRGSEKRLKDMYSYIILVASLFLMAGSIVTGVFFYDPYYKYNAVESALYAALHRTVWAVGSVGLMYVASYGHAKIIYKFFSWKPWVPLSKLVYGAYLIHVQFQLRMVARKGGADAVTYFDVMSFALSDIVLAFGSAFVLYLTVESPFRNIFTLLLVPQNDRKLEKNSKESQESISETTCDSHL